MLDTLIHSAGAHYMLGMACIALAIVCFGCGLMTITAALSSMAVKPCTQCGGRGSVVVTGADGRDTGARRQCECQSLATHFRSVDIRV